MDLCQPPPVPVLLLRGIRWSPRDSMQTTQAPRCPPALNKTKHWFRCEELPDYLVCAEYKMLLRPWSNARAFETGGVEMYLGRARDGSGTNFDGRLNSLNKRYNPNLDRAVPQGRVYLRDANYHNMFTSTDRIANDTDFLFQIGIWLDYLPLRLIAPRMTCTPPPLLLRNLRRPFLPGGRIYTSILEPYSRLESSLSGHRSSWSGYRHNCFQARGSVVCKLLTHIFSYQVQGES